MLTKAETKRRSSRPPRKARVLCVDDEAILLEVMRRILTRAGYDVVAINDSHEASQLLRGTPGAFDVIVTDESMPDVTGFDLATLAIEQRSDLGVILMTGLLESAFSDQAKAAGIRRVLSKPFLAHRAARRGRAGATNSCSVSSAPPTRSEGGWGGEMAAHPSRYGRSSLFQQPIEELNRSARRKHARRLR